MFDPVLTTERPARRPPPRRAPALWPDWVWNPFAVAFVLLVLGVVSLAVGRPFLFPSLAPATVAHANRPRSKAASLWGTIVGQLVAIASAYFSVWVTGAMSLPPALNVGYLPPARMWASVLASAIALFVQVALDAVDGPAAATLLLITLGAFLPTPRDVSTLLAGVLLMAALGEGVRRFRLLQLDGAAAANR